MRLLVCCMTLVVFGSGTVYSMTIGDGTLDNANLYTLSGTNSQLSVENIVVGIRRSQGNQLLIEDGGRLFSSSGVIGDYKGSDNNSVIVTGHGSQWVNSGDLDIGRESYDCSLTVSNGAAVYNRNAIVGRGGASYSDYHSAWNTSTVTGPGSRWVNAGSLTIGAGIADGANSVIVSGGGEVVVADGIIINDPFAENKLILGSGGKLTVQTNFNASMGGFIYNSGGALAVGGQLSGLSLLDDGCRLESASVLGDLTVNGTFAPGRSTADALLDGALIVTAGGAVEFEFEGDVEESHYDHLTVMDASDLDGTLRLLFLEGFAPTNGATFDLFDWGGNVVGEFDNIESPSLDDGLYWDVSELYTTGSVSVIPEPSSVVLLLLSGTVIWFRKYVLGV